MACRSRGPIDRHPQPRPDGAPSTWRPRPGAPGARGYEVLVRAYQAGLLVRMTGDTIALSPPLTIGEREIADIAAMLGAVLDTIE